MSKIYDLAKSSVQELEENLPLLSSQELAHGLKHLKQFLNQNPVPEDKDIIDKFKQLSAQFEKEFFLIKAVSKRFGEICNSFIRQMTDLKKSIDAAASNKQNSLIYSQLPPELLAHTFSFLNEENWKRPY